MNEDPRSDPGCRDGNCLGWSGKIGARKEHRFSGFGRSPGIEVCSGTKNCTISAPFLRHQTSCAAQLAPVETCPKVDRFLTEMVGVSGEPSLIKGFVGVGQVFGKVFRPQGRWLF